ncbi:bestrophin family protein [Pseudoxanthobacter soli]|nr:bestrophin family ion channel [Pseudoxanthobacter soli]
MPPRPPSLAGTAMIIRDRPGFYDLLFTVRGSVLPRIKCQLALSMALACLVVGLDWLLPSSRIFTLTTVPFTLIGLALAIFLGFRNSASYDRWWEGRKLWGDVVIRTRSATRLILSHLHPSDRDPAQAERMTMALVAFAYLLKRHLRDGTDGDARGSDGRAFLPADIAASISGAANPPDAALGLISRELAQAAAEGRIDPMNVASIEGCLTALAADQGGCERLKTTPLPFAYSLLLHRTAYLYCLALPFGLAGITGLMTPFVVGIVSYTIFGLDALGDEIEQPFGMMPNNLPLDAICRRIEIDLLAALGRTDLPPALTPKEFWLT